MAQEYISQVSEEIEGRVPKKLSKEFSRTESRNLGALSKLDEFLLNPQVRTCSVAVPGTCRNSDSENREPNGDSSPNDPCPEARISSHHSGNLNGSEVEEYPHKILITHGNFTLRNQLTENKQKTMKLIRNETSKHPVKRKYAKSYKVLRKQNFRLSINLFFVFCSSARWY